MFTAKRWYVTVVAGAVMGGLVALTRNTALSPYLLHGSEVIVSLIAGALHFQITPVDNAPKT